MPGGLFCTIGNPLNDGTWTYTWEKGRQLKRMQSVDVDASFVYNENGLRIQKTVNGVVTKYTLHGKNIVHMTQGNDTLHFYYDATNRPAMVEYNGVKYTYIYNLQSDVVAILNSAGTAVVKYRYDAWGKPISKTGDLASTLGTIQPFRYRGYVYDEETGLYYLRNRFYAPTLCRFCNADGQFMFDGTLINANAFAYCVNDPTNNFDPDGNEFRVVGAGVQVDASGAIGPAGVGVGVEVIVYWDEVVTAGGGPIVSIYVYNDINATLDLKEWQDQITRIQEYLQPIIKQLRSMSGNLKSLSFGDIKKTLGSASWGITGSALVITGNEEFDHPTDYEKGFDTTTVSLWRVKGSHSVSQTCKSYGVGYTAFGTPQTYGWSYSHSHYRLLVTLFDEEEE